jgi:hypothetical protein
MDDFKTTLAKLQARIAEQNKTMAGVHRTFAASASHDAPVSLPVELIEELEDAGRRQRREIPAGAIRG